MSASEPRPQTDPESWSAVHVLSLATSDPCACLVAVAEALEASGATLQALQLKPTAGDRFEAVLRLGSLSPPEARALSDRLGETPGIGSARVEHHLYTPATGRNGRLD